MKIAMVAQNLNHVNQQTAAIFPQYVAAIIANIAAIMIGMNRGWSSVTEYSLTEEEQYGFPISRRQFSWISALMPLGCLLGTFTYGWAVTSLGRKHLMLILAVPIFLGYILITFAHNVTMPCLGRFIVGVGAGGYCVAVPLYIGEFAETHIRGKLGVFFQILNTSGILFSYILGSIVDVFWLSFVCMVIPVIYGLLVLFIPESPIYFLEKGMEEEAHKSLQWFRGSNYNIEEELSLKKKAIQEEISSKLTFFEAFSSKAAIKGFVICMGLMVFRQLCGVSDIIFYNNIIFKEADTTISANLQTIMMGTVDLLFTFVSSRLVDRLGRRPLLLISITGMAVCTFFIGFFFYLKNRHYDVDSLTWMPVTFLCAFTIAYSLGFGPLPWVFLGEIFERRIAGYAVSIACSFNFLCTFLITFFFEDISSAVGREGVFFIFTACSAVGIVFVYCLVIETKNKPLEDIIKQLDK